MAAARKPQDHLPKKPGVFTFDHDGTTYELPPPSDALQQIPGRALRDMLMGGDDTAEARFGFQVLEAAGASQDALDALYDKPVPQMLQVIGAWMKSSDLSGATLPES